MTITPLKKKWMMAVNPETNKGQFRNLEMDSLCLP